MFNSTDIKLKNKFSQYPIDLGGKGLTIFHIQSVNSISEPPHDKTNKMACAPSEDSDQPGHPPSLISLRCPHEGTLGP